MSMMQNKELVRAYAEGVFDKGDLDAIDRLVAPNFVNHNVLPGQDPGPSGEKQRARMFRTAFPDLQVTAEDMIAEGDWVSARVMGRGTHRGEFLGIPPTGRPVSFQSMVMFRIANGRLAERWGTHDFWGAPQQMGVTCELQAAPAGR
mgnify:CR=1 FL=1